MQGSGPPAVSRAAQFGGRGSNVNRAITFGVACASAWIVFSMSACTLHAAVPNSEQLLPATTVAYVSIPDPTDLEARIKQTQLGQFAQDPSLKPFVDHLKESIPERLGDIKQRVGVSLEDLQAVAGGELAWGIVARQQGRAASVLLVDTSGKAADRDALIEKLDKYLMGLNSKKSSQEVSGVAITKYDVPPQDADDKARTAAYFIDGDLLCVADNSQAVSELASRLSAAPVDTLGSLEAYTAVMGKCRGESKTPANIRWFIQPFPLVDAMRTIRPRKSDTEDRLEQLRQQGFDAVKGIGGLVQVASTPKYDYVHHTAIYAPPAPGADGGDRYRLAMNIFKTPNRAGLELHNWTPRMIARYSTVNMDLLNAFDNVGSLFDSMIAGYDGAFETAMKRFKEDPFGPRIDFRNEIIASLGTRICAMTDYTLPINTDSERFLVAIEVKPDKEKTLKVALGKYLEKDDYIQKKLEERDIWEFQPEEEEVLDLGSLQDGGLVPQGAVEEETERLLTHSAVCVDDGQLFIASDVEFLRLAFKQAAENESLAGSYDYQAVAAALSSLAPNKECGWSFTRTDEAIRPTYALLRENRLPQGESFFARLLNELLTSPADQKNQLLRKQKLDGSELPSFELARRYFGPAGRIIRADEDGWLMTGVLLNKAEN